MDTIAIFTNWTCNQRCLFCNYRKEQDEPVEVRAERTLATIAKAARAGARTLVLTGGEPTLDAELVRFVRAGRAAGMRRIVLETNGMRLAYPRWAAELAHAGLTEARIALARWGPRASDEVTQLEGAFVLTVRGIQSALAARIQVDISVAITPGSGPELVELARQVARHWPKIRGFWVHVVTEGPTSQIPSFDEAAAIAADVARACREVGLAATFDSRHAVPLCRFPERQSLADLYAVGPPMQGHGFERVAACERCAARPVCPGLHGPHLRVHGREGFEPVPAAEAAFVRRLQERQTAEAMLG